MLLTCAADSMKRFQVKVEEAAKRRPRGVQMVFLYSALPRCESLSFLPASPFTLGPLLHNSNLHGHLWHAIKEATCHLSPFIPSSPSFENNLPKPIL